MHAWTHHTGTHHAWTLTHHHIHSHLFEESGAFEIHFHFFNWRRCFFIECKANFFSDNLAKHSKHLVHEFSLHLLHLLPMLLSWTSSSALFTFLWRLLCLFLGCFCWFWVRVDLIPAFVWCDPVAVCVTIDDH